MHSQNTSPSSPNRAALDALKRLPRLRRVWFVAQDKGTHSEGMLQSFVDALIHTATTTQQPLEFILAYTRAAGAGEVCTYIKDHEDPLNGPPRAVWRMYAYAPILTGFDLDSTLRTHLERL